MKNTEYQNKFSSKINNTLFFQLSPIEQQNIKKLALEFQFTHQELKKIIDMIIDLKMWQRSESFFYLWKKFASSFTIKHDNLKTIKNKILQKINLYIENINKELKIYPDTKDKKTILQNKKILTYIKKTKLGQNIQIKEISDNSKISGICPAHSRTTICCRLRTIDVMKNCIFYCNYCSIQSMFPQGDIIFDKQLKEKLNNIDIEPNKFYHFGTGQSSDALVWGNYCNLIDDLCSFAAKHPNILLEFKTKSDNITYFKKNITPPNVVCSWSLNPDKIIFHEEFFTPFFEERINAAKILAKNKIKIAFHLHPIIYFDKWKKEYKNIINIIINEFDPKDILFISMGTITLPKSIIKLIRKSNTVSKILQMPQILNAEKKITYPDNIKKEIFNFIFNCFKIWHNKVFFYLCMEESEIWLDVFNKVYTSNEEFETDFGKQVMSKIYENN